MSATGVSSMIISLLLLQDIVNIFYHTGYGCALYCMCACVCVNAVLFSEEINKFLGLRSVIW